MQDEAYEAFKQKLLSQVVEGERSWNRRIEPGEGGPSSSGQLEMEGS